VPPVAAAAGRRLVVDRAALKPGAAAMNATAAATSITMDKRLLSYYEALERASNDMLAAARAADWDQVVKLEGACVLLIAQLKHAATEQSLAAEESRQKNRIMQRILVNDAEIRSLAEPWLDELDAMMTGKSRTLH
jgi:flagellar protein FliT